MVWFIDALRGTFVGLTITWTEKSSMTGGERKTVNTSADTMVLVRSVFTDLSTQGDLWMDSVWQCYTLEPTLRKIPGAVIAMPQGKYEVVMYDSPRMKAKVEKWKAEGKTLDPVIEAARVPLLLNVPGHDFIEMHPGNGPQDTHDCILPGAGVDKDWVADSVKAFCAVVPKIEAKIAVGKFYIGIIGGGPEL